MKYIYPIIGVIIIGLSFYFVMTKNDETAINETNNIENSIENIIDTANEIAPETINDNAENRDPAEVLEGIFGKPISTNGEPAVAQEPNTVLATKDGFVPNTLEVTVGTKVKFVNNTNNTVWVASAPHPIHTDLADFDNIDGTVAGGTFEYTFEKAGAWKYHDHLNPTMYGKVIVK